MRILVESLKRMYTVKKRSQRSRLPREWQEVAFQRTNMNTSQGRNTPAVMQNESA